MFKIAVMGCGVVGSGVADILMEKEKSLSERFQEDVRLGKILDIRDFTGTPYAPYATSDAEEIFGDPEIKLIVMTIGGLDFPYALSKRALESGRHVVTSNKEVVAAYGRELTKLAFENGVQFLYEASAGGGIPVIRPMNICLSVNEIYEIQGILNGTTNYILTKMQQDKMTFEEALSLAQKKGFAEANPTADVDGHDACRKIAILSSIAYGAFVDYKEVPCKGIRDVRYEDLAMAEKAGFVIKLIASSKKTKDGVIISVEPLLLERAHMLSGVSSVFNAVLMKGSYTGDTMFYGKGAGKLPTASAVLGDIIEILCGTQPKVLPSFVEETAVLTDDLDIPRRYYLRVRLEKGVTGQDVDRVVRPVFGPESKVVMPIEERPEYMAVVTGYIPGSSLDARIAEFIRTVNVCCETIIRVED